MDGWKQEEGREEEVRKKGKEGRIGKKGGRDRKKM